METTTQTSTSITIPWYCTRFFWAVSLSLMLLWGIFSFLYFFSAGQKALGALDSIFLSLGAAPFKLLGFVLLSSTGEVVFELLYFLLLIVLIIKTFGKQSLEIKYPLILCGLFAFGNLLGIFYILSLGGF